MLKSMFASRSFFSSLRPSPTVSVELKLPVELNSFSDASRALLASEYEFSSTGNFNSTEKVGDARRLFFPTSYLLVGAILDLHFFHPFFILKMFTLGYNSVKKNRLSSCFPLVPAKNKIKS